MTTVPRSHRFILALAAPLLFGPTAPSGLARQSIPTPEEHLGHPLAADGVLPTWAQVAGYFRRLAEASPRVLLETVGTTIQGRDFLLATISSEHNLGDLEAVRAANRVLSDPRGRSPQEVAAAVEDGRVVLFVSCAMHATECAAPQFAMEFAYRLATSDDDPWRSARERVVVLLAPSLNPDGLDIVADWYNRTVGTPYEASGLLELYQHYAGHDNNRDWFMLTQRETRIVTELLYRVWRPQVYWDVHQQGSSRERFFVPPFRDPLNPNLDPTIIAAIDALGSRALLDMTREGYRGVSTGVSYDMWWNGGNRNVPVRHNIIGILTEAASARLATPVFLPRSELAPPRGIAEYGPSNRFPDPWPGGWWRLADIVDYELAFGRSLLASLAREPELWLENSAAAARRAIEVRGAEAPRGWVVPSTNRDRGAVRRLADVLLAAGVELAVAEEPVTYDGRIWPAGSLVVRRDQPYGNHAKDLFDLQRYPEGDAPYDVAGWTLSYLLGVHRVEVMQEIGQTGLRAVTTPEEAVEGLASDARLADCPGCLSLRDSDSWPALFARLTAGEGFCLRDDDDALGLVEPSQEEGEHYIGGPPRVGLYTPWSASMDEGWTRWLFDTFGLPYVRVRNEMLRAGALADFLDVLVIPSLSPGQLDQGRPPGTVPPRFAGGLAPEGAVAIEEFVRGGGRLICLGSSSSWAIDLFALPLVDVTRGEEAEGFSCPGSVLRGVPAESIFTVDLPASVALFFSRSCAWRPMTEEEAKQARRDPKTPLTVLLRYAPTRVLLSGWIEHPETIEGRAAWVQARHGAGQVHLFGFRPQYRGWAQATFPLLFRSILLGAGTSR